MSTDVTIYYTAKQIQQLENFQLTVNLELFPFVFKLLFLIIINNITVFFRRFEKCLYEKKATLQNIVLYYFHAYLTEHYYS